MAADLERIPPQNLEAEQSVLGAVLLDRDAAHKVAEILEPEDFYRDAHRLIYQAVLDLLDSGEAVDTVTVSDRLRKRRELEAAGGVTYLTTLVNSVPTAANAEHYARIVSEKAMLRRLIAAATDIVRDVYEGEEDVAGLIDKAEQRIFRVAQGRRRQTAVRLHDVLVAAFEQLERLSAHKGDVVGIPTGFKRLDEMTTGLHPSELIILAARPSVGKTTLSLNMALNAARHGVPVAFFSLEMSREQLALRLLASEAAVSMQRLRTGYVNEDDWSRLTRAASRLSEAPFFIDDTPNISLMELRARARRLKAEHDIGLVVVDYLQLMHTRGRFENRQQEISEISRSLKALARELDVPVIALSQLSRAVEQRQDRRPQLSDLRESGAIEQDADVVIFLWDNPEYRDSLLIEAIVAKQRNGPTGGVQLVFNKEVGRFADPELRREPA
ncbi:MAG: replicative DNA helicase [Thermaerobacter sp.]|nr:replicative DNA helicase [Bacillota bacterium]REJ37669.1 MAG: replicative DNA helicase [Bacillota bacterium]